MNDDILTSREFWGPTLKYLGVAVTMVLGVIGTIWDTHKEHISEDGSTNKRLGWAGKALVGGIIASSIIGTSGVVLEEAQKKEDTRRAEITRLEAKRQADAELATLKEITETSKSTAATLHGVVQTGQTTLQRLGEVTSSSAETLGRLSVVSTEVQRVRYSVKDLTATVYWSIPATDPTLDPIRNTMLMKHESHALNTPTEEDHAFFRKLFKDATITVILHSGPQSDDQIAAEANFGFGRGSDGQCTGSGPYCINVVAHRLSERKVDLAVTLPVVFVQKAKLATLYDYGGKAISTGIFYRSFGGPRGARIQSIVFEESASKMTLRVSNLTGPDRAGLARTLLPANVAPGEGGVPQWK